MPLIKSNRINELLQHKHQISNQIVIRFFQFIYNNVHAIALSSKHRMKKMLPEASYDTYPVVGRCQRSDGSITLEMVVVLPLFISFMVFFLFFFRILLVQESMEEALVYASRTVAITCFEERPGKTDAEAELLARAQMAFRKSLKENECPVGFIRGGALGISLLSSELTGDHVILRASYEMRLPCVLLGNYDVCFVQCAQSRKWIGNCSLEDGTDDGDQWVYITPYGTVYHSNRSCRYLDLSIRAVPGRSLLSLRNADREIYRKCESCGNSGNGMVYVTDYGTHYHCSLTCSGLKRTIYMVKLSQTGGRKSCSKCGIRQ